MNFHVASEPKKEDKDVIETLILNDKNARKRRAKISLEERFAMFPDHHYELCEELDWGPPVGNEIW
ncbi:MAG: hypothetical protein FWE05_11840 [Defluviitaleaceae bacterium]|nr:hypothetical protein [Defluviitaleaceae bacterium]